MDPLDLIVRHAMSECFGAAAAAAGTQTTTGLIIISGDSGPTIAPERDYPEMPEPDASIWEPI